MPVFRKIEHLQKMCKTLKQTLLGRIGSKHEIDYE